MKEIKYFESEDDFIKEAYKSKILENYEIEMAVGHERAHFNLAIERGLKRKYKIIRKDIRWGPFRYHKETFFVVVTNPTPEDLKAICLAPRNPSRRDKIIASRLFLWPYELFYNLIIKKKNLEEVVEK